MSAASRPSVVILGGGFGGLSAARALRGAPVDVLLIDRRNHHVFQPLLYQVATAALSPGDIASPIRWILRRQHNVHVWLGEVARVNPQSRLVHLADGAEVKYDYLIVATGATHAYFGHEEWREEAPGLKTLEDALEIRRRVLLAFERAERERDPATQRKLLTFVVVGGGPTGVELAGALAEISRRALADDFREIAPETACIILIEGGPDVLAGYPQPLRAFARKALERLGVAVWTGSRVTDIQPGRVHIGGETVEAGTILWAAGVAASPIGRSLGAPTDRVGRVIVQPDLTVPGHPEIAVVGDLAAFKTASEASPRVTTPSRKRDGGPGGSDAAKRGASERVGGAAGAKPPGSEEASLLPGVAQVAMQQARHAAGNILRAFGGEDRRPFVYRNFGNMATIGRNAAVVDFGRLRVKGYLAWLMWVFLHIFELIGFRNRLSVMIQWAFAYLSYQRSVRLITSDDRTIGPGPEGPGLHVSG